MIAGAVMDAKETLMRIVLVSLLLYAAASLASVSRELYRAETVKTALAEELAEAERTTQALRRKLESGWTEEELEAMARERLGLVRPEDRIFRFPPQAEAENMLSTEGQRGNTETERIFHGFGSWRR